MDYEEFEYIYLHMDIGFNKERTKLLFRCDVNNARQCNIVKKYMNTSPDEFEKIWFPLCEKQKIIRKQRLEEFKKIKPTDFSDMSLEQKLLYIDAITATEKSTEEWTAYFTEVQDNLKACLFSIQPSKKFLIEEQCDLNHFMNALIGVGFDRKIRETKIRTPEQRKQDIQDFIHIFSQAYNIPEPELRFENFPESKTKLGGFATENNKPIVKIHEKLLQDSEAEGFRNFGVLFHELIHARQHYWETTCDEKYSMFAKMFCFLDELISNKGLNFVVYTLQPREGHAYYMEKKFDEQCSERVLKSEAKRKGVDFQVARTLWFDYQR